MIYQKSIYFYSCIFILLTLGNSGPITNTTDFFATQLNRSLSFQSYSGYQQINWYRPAGQSGMFYQLYSSHGSHLNVINPNIPLIIWLQGGGGSSQFGAFTQLGPIRIKAGKVQQNTWAWNLVGHLLFIDSPLNIGFSYSGNRIGPTQVNSSQQTGNHLINFLCNFYQTWPQLLKNPLYVTGQSYAGHYIPVLARKLLTNSTLKAKIGSLEGIALGNAWLDPVSQMNFFDSYLWSVGVMDAKVRDIFKWYQTTGILNAYQGKYGEAGKYIDFVWSNDTTTQYYFNNASLYNFRNYNGLDGTFEGFLNKNKKQIGAKTDIQYSMSNDDVYFAFSKNGDVMRSTTRDLVQVLKRVKVLVYNGQQDACCSTPGVLQYLNSLPWDGILSWKRTNKQIWTIHSEVVGWAKSSGNLWFVLVNKAGHMVPTDQPRSAFNMITHFINNDQQWNL